MELMKEGGIKVQKTVLQNKYSEMIPYSLEYLEMTVKRELVVMNGLMDHFMKACFRMIKCLAMEECFSQTDLKYKENGRKIQSMDKAFKS